MNTILGISGSGLLPLIGSKMPKLRHQSLIFTYLYTHRKKITALIQNVLERSSAVLSNPIVSVTYAHLCLVCIEKGCECKKHTRCQRLATGKKYKIS